MFIHKKHFLCSFGLVFIILSLSLLSAFDWDTGIISYYKLDETTGTNALDELNRYNGTANNTDVFTTQVPGIINTGGDFRDKRLINVTGVQVDVGAGIFQ